MKEIISKILKKIQEEAKEESAFLDTENSPNIKIDKAKFKDILELKSNKKLIFIDGGNLEILKTPTISLFFNRIYYTTYYKNKRMNNKLFEFYTLITTENKNNKIFFKTENFFVRNKPLQKEYVFDSFDKQLVQGNRRAQISIVGNIIRRFAELNVIKEIKEENAIIILDGTLEATYPYEEDILKDIFDNKKHTICALSKTTELITTGGKTLTAYLFNLTKKEKWCYEFAKIKEEKHKSDIFFLKLHPDTKYVFRFEINNESEYDKDEILSLLVENSKDPIFLGYPYGLIEADRFARVSNKEKETLGMQLKIFFGKDIEKVIEYLSAKDAHDILDNIS